MKKDTLKLILISLAIHLLFYNPILLIILCWIIFGVYVAYITVEHTNDAPFIAGVMLAGSILGLFTLLGTDISEFNQKSFIKIPKIRNPFYYES